MPASSLVNLPPTAGVLPTGAINIFKSRESNITTTPLVAAGSLLVVGSFAWVPFALYFSWRHCKTRRRKVVLVLAVFIIIVLSPRQRKQSIVGWCLWSRFVEYLCVKVVGDIALPFDRSALYAVAPHGTFPFSLGVLSLGPLNKVFSRARPVVASAVLRFPGFGQLISAIGGIDAKAEAVSKAIEDKYSVGICPGGIAEMFCGYPQEGEVSCAWHAHMMK